MTTKKAYLLLQAVLCVLLTVILIATVIGIYHEGLERRAEHPLEWIYTREIVAEKFAPVAPLFFISVGMGLAGIFLDIRDDKALVISKDALAVLPFNSEITETTWENSTLLLGRGSLAP